MFETLPNPSLQTLLIAARAVALIGAFWIFALAFTRWRRAQEQANQQLHDQLQRALVEIHSLQESVAALGSKLTASSPRAVAAPPMQPAASAAQRGYDLALRMVKNGASVEALVTNCGLPRNEAQLLVRLHAARNGEARLPFPATAQPDAAAEQSWAGWSPSAADPAASPAAASASAPAALRRRGSLLSVAG